MPDIPIAKDTSGNTCHNVTIIHKAKGLRFEVQDTGIGIPQDKIDQIFGKFTQVDSSTTREYGGTGLGLTICKKLVEIMGGDIGVRSQPKKGSMFWFEVNFPVSDEQIEFRTDYTGSLADKKILIVDDYPLNLDLFSEYLQITGAKIDTATSASEALNKLRVGKENDGSYDIVLTDFAMPKMDGGTLSRKISPSPERYGNPKRILITAPGRKKKFGNLEYKYIF